MTGSGDGRGRGSGSGSGSGYGHGHGYGYGSGFGFGYGEEFTPDSDPVWMLSPDGLTRYNWDGATERLTDAGWIPAERNTP